MAKKKTSNYPKMTFYYKDTEISKYTLSAVAGDEKYNTKRHDMLYEYEPGRLCCPRLYWDDLPAPYGIQVGYMDDNSTKKEYEAGLAIDFQPFPGQIRFDSATGKFYAFGGSNVPQHVLDVFEFHKLLGDHIAKVAVDMKILEAVTDFKKRMVRMNKTSESWHISTKVPGKVDHDTQQFIPTIDLYDYKKPTKRISIDELNRKYGGTYNMWMIPTTEPQALVCGSQTVIRYQTSEAKITKFGNRLRPKVITDVVKSHVVEHDEQEQEEQARLEEEAAAKAEAMYYAQNAQGYQLATVPPPPGPVEIFNAPPLPVPSVPLASLVDDSGEHGSVEATDEHVPEEEAVESTAIVKSNKRMKQV